MRPGLLCLLLLPACFLNGSYEPVTDEYVLTWYCVSPEGCERTEEVARIDRASVTVYDFHLASTQDPSFDEQGDQLFLESLGAGCALVHYLSLFGHDLEPSRICYDAAAFELQLSIPNEDPTTYSQWVVAGRDVRYL